MEREHQGCLVGIGMLAICGVILFVAYKWDIPLLKFACYMFCGFIGVYVGNRYFYSTAEQREKNRFSRRTWILLAIGYLVLAALLAWWLEGRLW